EAAQREQFANRDEIARIVMACFEGGGPDQQRDDHARAGGGEADGEQPSGRRQRRRASKPADHEWAEPLSDRSRDHVIAERGCQRGGGTGCDGGEWKRCVRSPAARRSRGGASPIAATPRSRRTR